MGEIYLIRHGQASFGAENYDRLSPVGRRQARLLAKHLSACRFSFDAVYSGQMTRQMDTARAFCERFGANQPSLREPVVLPGFNEYDARGLLLARSRLKKDPQALTLEKLGETRKDRGAFQAYFADTVNRWLAGDYDGADDLETWHQFNRRVADAVHWIIEQNGRGKRTAVFTSAGPITAVLKRVLGISDRVAMGLSWQIINASVTRVKYGKGRLTLSEFNTTTHLLIEDAALLTYR